MACLNQVMRPELASADMAVLESCTEAWIAGLQLAVLSLRGYADLPVFPGIRWQSCLCR